MRIALVASQSSSPRPRDAAGQSQRVTSLAEALGRLGHRVTLYAPDDAPALPAKATLAPGVTVEHLPAGPGRQNGSRRPSGDEAALDIPAFSDHLARRWQQDPPDIAHAHFWTSGLAALAGARGLNLPVVQTFHSLGVLHADNLHRPAKTSPPGGGSNAARGSGPARRPASPARTSRWAGGSAGRQRDNGQQLARIRLEACLARNANAVLATSSEQMTKLAGLGVPRASIRVVPWGVDTGRFAPEGPVARRNGRPRLLAVRQSADEPGLDTVIRALAEIPKAELLIAGGPSGSGPANQGLAGLARDLGVADRITFTGDVSRTHLPALLRSADLLLSGEWEDSSGAVALQAMACGTPVAASTAGAVGDAVIDGTTGFLVPSGQPSALASRIRRLFASPMQLEAFSIAAVDRARSRYSWDRIGRETAQAYERCLPHQFPAADEPEPEDADSSQEG